MSRVYETDRLLLKALNQDMAHMVLAFYEDNRLMFEPWEPRRSPAFYTLSYQKASLTVEHNQMTEGKLLRYWVFLKDNPDEIIGSISFQNLIRGPYQSCSLGYKISSKHLHQGYAFESIQKGIHIVFEEYHLHRIEAFIMPGNTPSLRVIERLPFCYEGLSTSYALINDVWTDHRRYACINPMALSEGDHQIPISKVTFS